MSVAPDVEWQRTWGDLRARRMTLVAAIPISALVGVLSSGWLGWLLAVSMPVVALVRLYAWRCPGCHRRFTGASIAPMPSACVMCGRSAFDHSDADTAPSARPVSSRSIPSSIRLHRVVAASQVLGGALIGLVTVLAPFQGYTLVWWYFLMVEGIAIAGVASGVWLWQGRPEGLRLARILLALQVVKIYTPWFAYDMRAGLGILLHAGAETVGVRLDASGTLLLALQPGVRPEFAVNVLALIWLCALLGGRASRTAVSTPAGASAATPTA